MSMADNEQLDALILEDEREARRRNARSIHERNADRLAQALGGARLTAEQERSLRWLAGWEAETVDNIASAIESARALERET